MKIGRLLIGIVGSALVTSSALAADLPTVVAPPPAPPPMAAPAFDWGGLYIGGFAQAFVAPFGSPQAGVNVGYNVVRGGLVAGIEAEAAFFFGGGLEAQLQGHVGAALGQRTLVYGSLGAGWSGIPFWSYGAGLAVGLGQNVSVFTEVGQWRSFGGATVSTPLLTIGVNWHWNKMTRMMFNVIHAKLDQEATIWTFSWRGQVEF